MHLDGCAPRDPRPGFDHESAGHGTESVIHLNSDIAADPHGAEIVAVHVAGAGIDFTKHYPADPAVSVGEQFSTDPEARFVAARPEPIRFWVEFEGVSSPTRELMVVPYDQNGMPLDDGTPSDANDGNDSAGRDDGGASGAEAGTANASAGDAGTTGDSSLGGAGNAAAGGGAQTRDTHDDGGGCSLASGRAPGNALLLLLATAWFAARQRRKQFSFRPRAY